MKTPLRYWNSRFYPRQARPFKAWLAVFLFIVYSVSPLNFLNRSASAQSPATTPVANAAEVLRLERVPVEGGSELITIHAKLSGLTTSDADQWVPMVTVLRDTLGDNSPENDRLRYVWPLTYTRPSVGQRILGAIPFLYTKVGNKRHASDQAPPPVLDLAAPDREVWNRIFWAALQSLLLDPYGAPVKAATRSYRQNISDYRKSHVIRALSVLTLYQTLAGSETRKAFTESELAEVQARLLLTDKTFGGLVDSLQLASFSDKTATGELDERGHNWELLRQRAESESLYFEPLEMPDGSVTHAMLWVARSDLGKRRDRPFVKRFLNIDDPWTDKRLTKWRGHSEVRYFDSENRRVSSDQSYTRATEMIPLALYGLDHPKIPILLVDFRDGLNPKKREMSRRALNDVTRNVLSLSRFGDVPYFLGRTVFDFVTGRRGMDINQPSRLRTYSQLKLLLALNESLDSELRDEIGRRADKVSLNPMENDMAAEASVARQQYAALMSYAKSAQGLPARVDRDRRAELVAQQHEKVERTLFRVANIVSFGQYTHREQGGRRDVKDQLDVARRLSYHTRFLSQVAQSSPEIDVVWNLDEVRNSLRFVAEQGTDANSRAVTATAKIFDRTRDGETRRTCLESLSRIDTPKARKELIRISQNNSLDPATKQLITSYLHNPKRNEPLASSEAKQRPNRPVQQ